jgi:hypothetical protein
MTGGDESGESREKPLPGQWAEVVLRAHRETVIDRMQHDRGFCHALLDEFAEIIRENDEFAKLFGKAQE